MQAFRINNNKLVPIKEKPFRLEKNLQTLTENNLEEIFGLELVSTEFKVSGLFIDTLSFNPETNSFVIIEYKKEKSISVIDQGFSYLSLMLNNKADFILEYNEKKKDNLKRNDVDWSQTRIYFVSPTFTIHQQNAINFKDLPIELWQVTQYENNLVLFNHIRADGGTDSIKTLGKSKEIRKVSSEVKEYSEKEVIGNNKKILGLYNSFREKVNIINPELSANPTKNYVGFKLPNNWRILFNVRKSWQSKEKGYGLVVEFTRSQTKDYNDPDHKLEYIKNSKKHFNQHLSRMYIYNEDDIDYASLLLKQAYDRFVKGFYSEE